MGRTLHYQVMDKTFIPTNEQQHQLYALTKRYLANIEWTCETPSMDYYDYYPNWEKLKREKGRDVTRDEGWNIVNLSIQSKLDSGYSEIQARKQAQKEGLISFSREGILRNGKGKKITFDYFSGFTKVASNELNAHAVIRFILECSFILKDVEILLSDEGEALFAPLVIKNGKAKPDLKGIQSAIVHWNSEGYKEFLHNPESAWDVTANEKYFNEVLAKQWSFGDPQQFIRPLNDDGYLLERKEFKTTKLNFEAGLDLRDLVGNFISNEKAESAKYYKDVKQFPVLDNQQSRK